MSVLLTRSFPGLVARLEQREVLLLITGDADLLVLERFERTRILSPAQFLRTPP
ncbi:MAG: hypothetical protein IPM49_12280 [Flavobacteriales bacterium]|nr:hypothetical protein [Flavobacteriales bacterium]